MTNVVTRFAPSPTGRLHVGNVRTAVHNWLWARKNNGRFLLRMDDTDAARSTEAFAQGIRADLDWLGMTPDDEVKQSDRFARYEEMFGRLVASGRIYPCYESAQELALKRKVLLSRGRAEERRVGKERVVRVDLGGRRILKKKKNKTDKI